MKLKRLFQPQKVTSKKWIDYWKKLKQKPKNSNYSSNKKNKNVIVNKKLYLTQKISSNNKKPEAMINKKKLRT